ncbi:hypothetical protein CW751_02820 [Brumimicrobium salinarum]|uniref:Uncharacterized protein n=1 Tax=Brumimicrobium salinarum TaxID=2058658 RepID=A0A2I0R789_9FLAO|nr:hypothetical protein [Brumimicrobium salinarum]PKR82280.1 hypothetical protein CW751_02820 [Brumimicrobium salinarum]
MKKQAIIEVADNKKFYCGTRFRQYKIGLNVKSKEENYYEYMLIIVPGEVDHLLLTCVEGYKSGNSLAFVKAEPNEMYVTAKSLKSSMGIDNAYLVIEE